MILYICWIITNKQAHERAASLVESSQAIYRRADDNRRTTEQTRNHTDTAHNSLERVSEYISTSRRVNERYGLSEKQV